ncbi:hypothetical protein KEH51_17510 [[Brevibacterium] frigoritolerans]|uniref:Uncharacterized protein n=1 Tax=Peribacillus frigoritolerans TaxID=450367 RepID=A0A941J5T3_9BACI|nr:hypothetical protein [Peribacillus frigoritolerans]
MKVKQNGKHINQDVDQIHVHHRVFRCDNSIEPPYRHDTENAGNQWIARKVLVEMKELANAYDVGITTENIAQALENMAAYLMNPPLRCTRTAGRPNPRSGTFTGRRTAPSRQGQFETSCDRNHICTNKTI